MKISLTYRQITKLVPALMVLAQEKRFSDTLTIVRISRLKRGVLKEYEPITDGYNAMVEEFGTIGEVRCPSCETPLWESEQFAVNSQSAQWPAFQKAQDAFLDDNAVEIDAEPLRISDLMLKYRDERGKVTKERYPLSSDDLDAFGDLLDLEMPAPAQDEDEE